MEEGPLTGSYARDIKCFVLRWENAPGRLQRDLFKLARKERLKDAFKKAGPKISGTVYMVEVLVPSDCMGEVMSDLQKPPCLIEGMRQ
jgi:elongation factor G